MTRLRTAQRWYFWLISPLLASALTPTWVSLAVQVPQKLTDAGYSFSQVPVFIGTPPQPVDMTIDLSSNLFAAFGYDCLFCPGTSLFDGAESSTYEPLNQPWPEGNTSFNGAYVRDTISFGGITNDQESDFVLIENMATDYNLRLENGQLGVFVNGSDQSPKSVFTRLWAQGALLNPVIGFRFDPVDPKITIGALDPADYAGTINWVEMGVANTSFDIPNIVKIDGLKGFNGSFLPFGDKLAGLSSLSKDITVPDNSAYMDTGYSGPIGSASYDTTDKTISYTCNDTSKPLPYVSLSVTINGVDYQIDSQDNMLRQPTSQAPDGNCTLALANATSEAEPKIVLGLPFLRSVYLAYRFPTDNCPGYYGFAFLPGSNRTASQIAQPPASTPSLSAQCLSLVQHTSTLTPIQVTRKKLLAEGSFQVYGQPDGDQVPLIGIHDLPGGVWDGLGS